MKDKTSFIWSSGGKCVEVIHLGKSSMCCYKSTVSNGSIRRHFQSICCISSKVNDKTSVCSAKQYSFAQLHCKTVACFYTSFLTDTVQHVNYWTSEVLGSIFCYLWTVCAFHVDEYMYSTFNQYGALCFSQRWWKMSIKNTYYVSSEFCLFLRKLSTHSNVFYAALDVGHCVLFKILHGS